MPPTKSDKKAVAMVHGAVLVVRGKTYSVLTWSKDKSKKTAMMATILHQFFAEHADVLVGVKVMHIWADNASTYHQADLLGCATAQSW